MQVDNLLVDEISVNARSQTGAARSTLYHFARPTWISTHQGRSGQQIGPVTLLDSGRESSEIDVKSFGKRKLYGSEQRGKLVISYKDRWTVPPSTVYALVLPKTYIASDAPLVRVGQGDCPPPVIGGDRKGRLFYHTIFGHSHADWIFDVEARLEPDEARSRELIESAEAVAGSEQFQSLGHAIAGGLKSTDFWLKLLEIGTKLWGSK